MRNILNEDSEKLEVKLVQNHPEKMTKKTRKEEDAHKKTHQATYQNWSSNVHLSTCSLT